MDKPENQMSDPQVVDEGDGKSLNPDGEDDDDDDDDVEEDEEDNEEPVTQESQKRSEKARMERDLHRISRKRVPLQVHDVVIWGNTRTKDSLIEVEVGGLKQATTLQELLQAASIANERLQRLDVFDSVSITLDSGPPELPGTVNVIVEVSETKNPLAGDIGIYSKPEARSWSIEGSLKRRNLFGYGDLWDGSLAYCWHQSSEVSIGVALPRIKGLVTPVMARLSLSTQDWLKFSSYKEQSLGLSLGLISSRNHDLAYNFYWNTLTDPSQMSYRSVRRQLGHGLLSSLKYTFKIDRRNSTLRPTKGYAFSFITQIGGLIPDYRSLRFLRQEFDLRYAFPLGFLNAAFHFGISGGVLFPWGNGFLNMPTSLPQRFFLGGSSSPFGSVGGPKPLLGFTTRGPGVPEPHRQARENTNDESSEIHPGTDFLGGDLTVTSFANLSFDLPLKVLREAGIHGHVFACTGSLNKLSVNAYRDFSFQKFWDSFRSSLGFGVVVPTKLIRMEVNYCYILKQQQEHDRGKTGLQFSFSSRV